VGFAALALLTARGASGERVTLPAAASLQGLAPFYSDVRAFNTSYTSDLEVTARYRCFLGPCPVPAPGAGFILGPRESLALNDIVVETFAAPNSGGGVEFDHAGAPGQLVITSRLYSTSPTPTVGMFIPGLPSSEAHTRTVLTSVRNGGPGEGFRTNVGVFNPGDDPISVAFTIHDATGETLGGTVFRDVAARSGTQVTAIFTVAGAPEAQTDNAYITVAAGAPVFAYAAVIDNATSDPIFVSGSADSEAPPASGPETVLIAVRAWDFSPGGPISPPLSLRVGSTYTLVFQNVDLPGTPGARHGFSGISELGLPATDDISPGHNFVITGFAPQAWQRGSYPFVCTQSSCGGDPEQHAGMIGLLVVE
jgi:hypothetical protein